MSIMQNRYKLWLVLTLVVAFGAGLMGGICGERYYFHGRRHAQMQRPQRTGAHFPSLERLSRELGLSAGQQDQIRKIFEDHDAELRELRAEMNSRLGTIRSGLKDKMDAVLTPEQKTKLEASIKEHMEQRKREAEKRRSSSDRERPQDKPTGESK
jgi:Spy/CpxP family protein refolding chaperone